jgi:hypothetical protein
MFFPGVDPKKMSDEELMRKVTELQGKMVFAYGIGNYDMINQMQQILEAFHFEQQERLNVKLFEMRERMFKDVIETEPELVIKKEVETKKKSGKGSMATFFPPKTKKPSDQNLDQPLPARTNKPT